MPMATRGPARDAGEAVRPLGIARQRLEQRPAGARTGGRRAKRGDVDRDEHDEQASRTGSTRRAPSRRGCRTGRTGARRRSIVTSSNTHGGRGDGHRRALPSRPWRLRPAAQGQRQPRVRRRRRSRWPQAELAVLDRRVARRRRRSARSARALGGVDYLAVDCGPTTLDAARLGGAVEPVVAARPVRGARATCCARCAIAPLRRQDDDVVTIQRYVGQDQRGPHPPAGEPGAGGGAGGVRPPAGRRAGAAPRPGLRAGHLAEPGDRLRHGRRRAWSTTSATSRPTRRSSSAG